MRRMTFPSMLALAALACMAPDDGGQKTPQPPAPPTPPERPPEAAKAPKNVHVVWCAPGHEGRKIGGVYKGPQDVAERLAKAGTVRPAEADEVKAAKAAEAVGDL